MLNTTLKYYIMYIQYRSCFLLCEPELHLLPSQECFLGFPLYRHSRKLWYMQRLLRSEGSFFLLFNRNNSPCIFFVNGGKALLRHSECLSIALQAYFKMNTDIYGHRYNSHVCMSANISNQESSCTINGAECILYKYIQISCTS